MCIPFWQGLYPAVMYCWALARVNPSWWCCLRQSIGHVADVCQSSTSKPHEKHTFQLGKCLVVFENSGRRVCVVICNPPGGAIGAANMGNLGIDEKLCAGTCWPPRARVRFLHPSAPRPLPPRLPPRRPPRGCCIPAPGTFTVWTGGTWKACCCAGGGLNAIAAICCMMAV